MGVLLVHVVDHFFGAFDAGSAVVGILVFSVREEFHVFRITHFVDIAWVLEFHRVPVFVASPILPVLDDTVQWYFQFTVLIYYFAEFVRTFIAFAALPESQCPERIERGLTGQLAHSGYYTVRIAAVNEIIISAIAYFRVERHLLRIVEESSRRVIIPIKGISLDGMNEWNADTHILIAEKQFLIALVHFTRLLLSQTVDYFVFIQQKGLADIERRNTCIIERSELCSVILVRQQTLPGRIEKMDTTSLRVHFHLDKTAA